MLLIKHTEGNDMIHTKYGGSGLGLFICKSKLRLGCTADMKGSRNYSEVASRFKVNLVLEAVRYPTLRCSMLVFRFFIKTRALFSRQDNSFAKVPDTITAVRAPRNDQRQLRILVVEDNIVNQTILRRQLRKAGHLCEGGS